jgi:hypothetical protein
LTIKFFPMVLANVTPRPEQLACNLSVSLAANPETHECWPCDGCRLEEPLVAALKVPIQEDEQDAAFERLGTNQGPVLLTCRCPKMDGRHLIIACWHSLFSKSDL